MGKKARREVVDELAEPGQRGVVLVATVGLVGEGFDCPTLDTVLMAFPVKFKGSVVQYVGRILRPLPDKTEVVVHDYVDMLVPVLARMYHERARGYANLGFQAPKLPKHLAASSGRSRSRPSDSHPASVRVVGTFRPVEVGRPEE
jgi:superfamily II DNA or RNA helicase